MPNTTYTQNHETKPLSTSSQTTFQIPKGGKIVSLPILFTTSAGAAVTEAQIRSEITNIRLAINGKDVVNASPTIILDGYEALGVSRVGNNTAVAGVIELNIGRLLFADPIVRNIFGYGTADVQNIQVTITAGTLSAIANASLVSERIGSNEVLGTYCKLINYPQTYNAAATHTADTLPRDPDTTYLAALIDDGASGTITSSELKVNSATVRENLNSTVNALLLSNKGYTQTAGYFIHALCDGSLGMAGINMQNVNDLRFATTFSVAPGAGGYSITLLTVVNLPNTL